jgi:hypothetical protein
MNPLKSKLTLISLALVLPAVFLITTGVLHVGFGAEAANRLLDAMMAQGVFKLVLSPAIVLGGPLVVFGLNAWQVFHLSADHVNEEFVIALSVKRTFGRLFCLALAGGLLLLLGAYAFVENFEVVAR